MLILRPALPEDFPPLAILLETHSDKFFDDYATIDRAYLAELINNGSLLIIDSYGYAVGAAWFNEQFHDLHINLHLLVNPQYWRPVVKQKLCVDILRLGFQVFNVQKIKAEAMDFQKLATRLLGKHHFRFVGRFNKETRRHGKYMDVVHYELKRSKFKQFYGDV